jgi:hypothetical protein
VIRTGTFGDFARITASSEVIPGDLIAQLLPGKPTIRPKTTPTYCERYCTFDLPHARPSTILSETYMRMERRKPRDKSKIRTVSGFDTLGRRREDSLSRQCSWHRSRAMSFAAENHTLSTNMERNKCHNRN